MSASGEPDTSTNVHNKLHGAKNNVIDNFYLRKMIYSFLWRSRKVALMLKLEGMIAPFDLKPIYQALQGPNASQLIEALEHYITYGSLTDNTVSYIERVVPQDQMQYKFRPLCHTDIIVNIVTGLSTDPTCPVRFPQPRFVRLHCSWFGAPFNIPIDHDHPKHLPIEALLMSMGKRYGQLIPYSQQILQGLRE